MKLLIFCWALALCDDEEKVDDGIKVNTFWAPPVCTRQVNKGDFVR